MKSTHDNKAPLIPLRKMMGIKYYDEVPSLKYINRLLNTEYSRSTKYSDDPRVYNIIIKNKMRYHNKSLSFLYTLQDLVLLSRRDLVNVDLEHELSKLGTNVNTVWELNLFNYSTIQDVKHDHCTVKNSNKERIAYGY